MESAFASSAASEVISAGIGASCKRRKEKGGRTTDPASVAGLLVTTEAMVAELPKKEQAHPMPGGGGMGGMDY